MNALHLRKRNWGNTLIILLSSPIYIFLFEKGNDYLDRLYKWMGYQSNSDNYVFIMLFSIFYLSSIFLICFWNEMRRSSSELLKKEQFNK